jgi:ADP-ribose pyrophosphatase
MSFETVLASKRVYEGRILNLRVDQIRTSAGVESIREIVENGGAVAIVPIDEHSQVVLVKQYRHAVRAVVTEVPAGKLDGDEDPLEAAQRELAEETGYRAGHFAVGQLIRRRPGAPSSSISTSNHLILARPAGC